MGKNDTAREQTRLPDDEMRKQIRREELLDPEKYRHVLVEDKIEGVKVNFRNVAWYKKQGYEVVSNEEEDTGHEALTLMAITHEEFARREAERRERDNRGHALESDKDAISRAVMSREGVLIRESAAIRGKDIPKKLPSAQQADEDAIRRAMSAAGADGNAKIEIAKRRVEAEIDRENEE